jgi:hypothetical protein
VEQGQWSKIMDLEEKYDKYEELFSLTFEQRQYHMDKKELFDEFAKETLKEIEVMLYFWEKKITRLENGGIKFERVKLCPINKEEYKETIYLHLKDIRPRFERLWNYFSHGHQWDSPFHEVVKKDLDNYSFFAEKLWRYFELKKEK